MNSQDTEASFSSPSKAGSQTLSQTPSQTLSEPRQRREEHPTQPQAHPLAGQLMTGAEIIVQVLADQGCNTLFGYSGGAILPVFDALYRHNLSQRREDGSEPMPLIVPASEQGAGFMASGLARATGKPGVVLVTSGPGATNLATPVRDALADSIPMVVLSGQVGTSVLGSDAFQEAPVANIMSHCAKHVFLVTCIEELEATIRTAFELAMSGRRGPVAVDIPKDLQNASFPFDGQSRRALPGYRERVQQLASRSLDASDRQALLQALAQAERPLIYAGGGVLAAEAAPELNAFAQQFSLPVTTTLMGLGAIDSTSELALGMLGMHGTAYANYAVEDCDFLLALGARFDDRVAGEPERFAPQARFIAQIDIDPSEISRVKPVDWHHLGPMKEALRALMTPQSGDPSQPDRHVWHAHLQELKRHHAMNHERGNGLIQPQTVLECVNRITRGEALVTTGVGQHQMWAAQYLDFRQPRQWLTSGAMGTMGFGLPAAIGAQLACPDALVITVDGDGSIRMNLGELETVTSYQLPIKVLLLNNVGDGMVRQWQKLFYKGRLSATDKNLRKKDFVQAARADGFDWSRRLDDPAQMEETLKQFLSHPGPAFLEVMVDPNADVYPMVGPGKGYADMLTGPHIPSRHPQPAAELEPTHMF